MFRRIVLVGSGALALSALLIGRATAKVTGNVNCMLTGSAAISPGLPLNSPGNATKKFKTTVKSTGTLSNCTGTQTGTKKGAQIEGGTVVATAKTSTPVILGAAIDFHQSLDLSIRIDPPIPHRSTGT